MITMRKYRKEECPKCGQPIEYPADADLDNGLVCPSCETSFHPRRRTPHRWAAVLLVSLVAVAFSIGIYTSIRSELFPYGEPPDESEAEERARLRAEAERDFQTALTNDIVGLHRIISADTSFYEKDVKQWHAEAAVDYVNIVGGIQRTNVRYAFNKTTGYDGRSRTYCYPTTARR